MSYYKRLQTRVWEIVDTPKPGDNLSQAFDLFILTLIIFNVCAVIAGSVKWIDSQYKSSLEFFELVSVLIFSTEYLLRSWSCVVQEDYKASIAGRISYLATPMQLIDLMAILPFFLPFVGIDLRTLRIFRLLRVIRIAKLGRYYSSLSLIKRVIANKKEELILTSVLMVFLLITSSSIIFHFESTLQPDVFSSIPATMWWAIATLTTVGYGDMIPQTPIGQFLASIFSILGIGMFALPTGILGAGFIEEIGKRKINSSEPVICPHCGQEVNDKMQH